ncbi:hypothetical protein Q5P01_008514 [Channa striata]|uniref:Ig-like domain-containing protein n=1 Tax=Channa striata TaxID=64152 RepID=A0AA88N0U0_CHASR|nr:hypothetical protein Q5P01_008514 [Channa striata]
MLVIFHLMLLLKVGRCTDECVFETKTFGVGDDVDLTCIRRDVFLTTKAPELDIIANIQDPPSAPVHAGDSVTLQCSVVSDSERKTCSEKHSVYWFRAGSDQYPSSVIHAPGNIGDQCEKSHEADSPQKCFYSFSKTISSSDDGTYYCAVATCGRILFGNGTKLDIQEQHRLNLHKASMVLFLLCSTLAISLIVNAVLIFTIKKKKCDSHKDAPATSGNQKSPQYDEGSLIYSAPSFTREKAAKRERGNGKRTETVYTIKLQTKSCGCCNASVLLQTNATASMIQESQQTDEDSLVYSAPTFNRRKSSKAERKNARPSEDESIYTDVRAVALD